MKQPTNQQYNRYVENVTPTASCAMNCLKAFLVGGIICTIGQILLNLFKGVWGLEQKDAQGYVTICLVLLSVVLTAFNLYGRIAQFGGAGCLVPITGFANSVASTAIEYQAEGQVFGIGVKIFTIAGPVILYGIFAGWVLGFIYWVLKCMGVA